MTEVASHPNMAIKPTLRGMHRDVVTAFGFIEQLAEVIETNETEIKRLQERVAALEAKDCCK
mgnify:CR=1 FL=1